MRCHLAPDAIKRISLISDTYLKCQAHSWVGHLQKWTVCEDSLLKNRRKKDVLVRGGIEQ